MANFIPSKHEASEYNNGVQYVGRNDALGIEGNMVQAETINNLVESALYSQDTADSAKTTANNALDKINGFIDNRDVPPPIGYHYIQYNGEPTPAQRYAGTSWEIDTDYQGRVLIGSGGNYALGATGGATTHTLTIEEMPAHGGHIMENYSETMGTLGMEGKFLNVSTLSTYGTVSRGWREWSGDEAYPIALTKGASQPLNIMPSYTVVNYWKRTA